MIQRYNTDTNLSLTVNYKEKPLQRFQEQRPVDVVGEYRWPRRRDLPLLDGVRRLGGAFLLLDAPDLVNGLLKNRALIRFDRQRAHVREIGGYQLGQFLYVDVLLFSATFLIVAFVTVIKKVEFSIPVEDDKKVIETSVDKYFI